MVAVVEVGGKQYRVEVGDIIKTEKVDCSVGADFCFEKLHFIDGKCDHDSLEKARIVAEILEHKRTDKILIFKKIRRHNYRRKRGHRQHITVMRIKQISC